MLTNMKTKFFFGGLLALALAFNACSSDDNGNVIINTTVDEGTTDGVGSTDTGNLIGGTLTEDLTLESGEFVLTEALIVPDGITLTINPGVVIRANIGSDVFIAIAQLRTEVTLLMIIRESYVMYVLNSPEEALVLLQKTMDFLSTV